VITQFSQDYRCTDPDDYFLIVKAPDKRVNRITVFDLSDSSDSSGTNRRVGILQRSN
jgi:hypothetical protein